MTVKNENGQEDGARASEPPPSRAADAGSAAQAVAAVWTALVAFLGLAACGAFTYVKYRSDYACDDSYLSACSTAFGSDCSATFSSPWATLAGLPITIYGTGFYAVALVVAVSVLLQKRLLGGAERVFLLFAGLADVGVSIVLAAYAKVALHTVCAYCATLYVVSALFLGCVLWLNARGTREALREGLGFGWLRRTAGPPLVVVVSLAVIATIPQAWGYRVAQAAVGVADCPADVTPMPVTEVRDGASAPQWMFADFLDPSCPHCRHQYRAFGALLADPRYKDSVQVQTFLYPRQPNSPCAPPGFDVRAPEAHQDPCLAAIAVVCAERLKPKSGAAMMGRVLDLQGKETPWFSLQAVKREAAALGIDGARMSKCLDDDSAAKVVRAHVAFGMAQGIVNTPRLYAIPVVGGSPQRGRALRFEGGKSMQVYERVLGLRPEQSQAPENN